MIVEGRGDHDAGLVELRRAMSPLVVTAGVDFWAVAAMDVVVCMVGHATRGWAGLGDGKFIRSVLNVVSENAGWHGSRIGNQGFDDCF